MQSAHVYLRVVSSVTVLAVIHFLYLVVNTDQSLPLTGATATKTAGRQAERHSSWAGKALTARAYQERQHHSNSHSESLALYAGHQSLD